MKVLFGPTIMAMEKSIPELQKQFPSVEFVYCGQPAELAGAIADADVYVGLLNRETFLAAKKLKWIQSASTGVDYFMGIPELVQGPVLLTTAGGTHTAVLAESALGMILAFTRGIRESIQLQPKHVWAMRELRPKNVELTGSTLGIIGLGASGRGLAVRAKAFGMRIIAVDLYRTDKPEYVDELWGNDRLDDLLRQSDYVVITVPLTKLTRGMIGAREIGLMKPTAMLVHISRGGVVDQAAVAAALREKRLAAAALEVFSPEPLPPDSELWDIENLLITSHIAGGTQFERQYMTEIFSDNLNRFLTGQRPLRNEVNKERGF